MFSNLPAKNAKTSRPKNVHLHKKARFRERFRIFSIVLMLRAEIHVFCVKLRKIPFPKPKERIKEVLIQLRTDLLCFCVNVRNRSKTAPNTRKVAKRIVLPFEKSIINSQHRCAYLGIELLPPEQ